MLVWGNGDMPLHPNYCCSSEEELAGVHTSVCQGKLILNGDLRDPSTVTYVLVY